MPIVRFIKNEKQNPSSMKGSIDYCLQKFKTVDTLTGKRYVSGINCNGLNAYKEFMTTKFANNANNGRYFYQYVQSFSPKDNVDYDKAHKIALEFAEKAWQGHEVLVTTHCDRNHIHTHFIINSVNFETGKKLRQNPNTLKSLRKLNDEICAKYDVAPLKPYTKTKEKRLSDGEYRMAMKGESWKFALMFTIDNAMKKCKTKKEFMDEMKKNGYEVLWTDERKYITYTCPNKMKCRDIKLHQEKYRKEKMELEFELRRVETEKCTAESFEQRYDSEDGTGITGNNRRERLLESTDQRCLKTMHIQMVLFVANRLAKRTMRIWPLYKWHSQPLKSRYRKSLNKALLMHSFMFVQIVEDQSAVLKLKRFGAISARNADRLLIIL